MRIRTTCLALAALLIVAALPLIGQSQTAKDQPAGKPNSAATPAKRINAKTKEFDANWVKRHDGFVAIAKKGGVDVLFQGDSITDGWKSNATWKKHFEPLKSANFGIGGDRTEHVLWRLQNGELEGIQPKVMVLMIGTNNTGANSADEIADGIKAIVKATHAKSPTTKVLLLAVFPRGEKPDTAVRKKITAINKSISTLDNGGNTVKYMDIGEKFMQKDGSLTKDIMPDFLHLSARGYEIWGDAMVETVRNLAQAKGSN